MSLSTKAASQKSRSVTGDQADPSASPDPAMRQKCHARPANDSHASEVPRWLRKTNADVAKYHACHAKVPRRHGRPSRPKRVTKPSHASEVPRLPRKTNVNVAKRHACHAKRTWMSPSTTPAVQECRGVTGDQADPSASPDPAMCQKCHVKDGV